MLQQPVVGQVLALAEESPSSLWTMLHHDHVNEGAARGTQSLLAQAPCQQLPILDQHLQKTSILTLPALHTLLWKIHMMTSRIQLAYNLT